MGICSYKELEPILMFVSNIDVGAVPPKFQKIWEKTDLEKGLTSLYKEKINWSEMKGCTTSRFNFKQNVFL